MFRKAAIVAIVFACFPVFATLTAPRTVAAQQGQKPNGLEHAMRMAGGQATLTQRISKQMLLVALGVEKQQNFERLKADGDRFRRVLQGLQAGDQALELEPATQPGLLKPLSKVARLWPGFEIAVYKSIESGVVSANDVRAVGQLNLPLFEAAQETAEAYKEEVTRGTLHSMLGSVIHLAGRQRTLIQKMSKEYLMVAYGYEPEANKQELANNIALFDRAMNALISGDAELGLLAAPTPEIAEKLRRTQSAWENELRPIMEAVAAGGAPDSTAISKVANLNMPLDDELQRVLEMLEAL
jgi:hypothetical protein